MKKIILLLWGLLLANCAAFGQYWDSFDYWNYLQVSNAFQNIVDQSKMITNLYQQSWDNFYKQQQENREKKHEEAWLNPDFQANILTEGNDKYYLSLSTDLQEDEFDVIWEYQLIRGTRKESIPDKFCSVSTNELTGTCSFSTEKVLVPGMRVIVKAKHTNRGIQVFEIPYKNTEAYDQFALACREKTVEVKRQQQENNRLYMEQMRMLQQMYQGQMNQSNSFGGGDSQYSPKKSDCSYCGGKGWVPGCKTPNYGGGSYWCDECDAKVPASHSHDQCPSCRGFGYINRAF